MMKWEWWTLWFHAKLFCFSMEWLLLISWVSSFSSFFFFPLDVSIIGFGWAFTLWPHSIAGCESCSRLCSDLIFPFGFQLRDVPVTSSFAAAPVSVVWRSVFLGCLSCHFLLSCVVKASALLFCVCEGVHRVCFFLPALAVRKEIPSWYLISAPLIRFVPRIALWVSSILATVLLSSLSQDLIFLSLSGHRLRPGWSVLGSHLLSVLVCRSRVPRVDLTKLVSSPCLLLPLDWFLMLRSICWSDKFPVLLRVPDLVAIPKSWNCCFQFSFGGACLELASSVAWTTGLARCSWLMRVSWLMCPLFLSTDQGGNGFAFSFLFVVSVWVWSWSVFLARWISLPRSVCPPAWCVLSWFLSAVRQKSDKLFWFGFLTWFRCLIIS
jgi:hypothetical protein